jgi:hypothetical protein
MAYSYPTTPGYHETGSAPVTAAAMTISCRFKIANGSSFGMYVQLFNSAGPTQNYFRLGSDDSRKVYASAKDSEFTGTATHGTNLTNATWGQAGAIFESTSSRYAVFNGVLSSQNTVSVTPSGINRVRIGGNTEQAGDICMVAIWNVAITDTAKWAALSAGYAPPLVQRNGLVFYAPLIRDVVDVCGLSLSATGSPSVIDHPRVIMPRSRNTICVPAGAAFQSAWARGSNVLISPGSV